MQPAEAVGRLAEPPRSLEARARCSGPEVGRDSVAPWRGRGLQVMEKASELSKAARSAVSLVEALKCAKPRRSLAS